MGAWSHTSFGNDDAGDFIYDAEKKGVRAVEEAIRKIEKMRADDYIESSDASVVIAAGELLATANGKPPIDFPEEARNVSARMKRDGKLQARASAAIARVLAASELREVWEESSDFGAWRADVEALIERLK